MATTEQSRKTALYRHFDADGLLLYVGISRCALGRLGGHRSEACWYDQISRVTIEWRESRDDALKAEAYAIWHEGPLYNVIGSRSQPGAWSPLLGRVVIAPPAQRTRSDSRGGDRHNRTNRAAYMRAYRARRKSEGRPLT